MQNASAAFASGGTTGLQTVYNNFLTLVRAINFDEQSAAQRTVTDWFVPMTAAGQLIPTITSPPFVSSIAVIQQIADVIYRFCYATDAAENGGPVRISSAQATAVLAAYNATWGTF
jgi:hypothetical protein